MLYAISEAYPDRPPLIIGPWRMGVADILYFPNDYPAVLNEFATAPASSSIELFSEAYYNAPGGVRVGDILHNFLRPNFQTWWRRRLICYGDYFAFVNNKGIAEVICACCGMPRSTSRDSD